MKGRSVQRLVTQVTSKITAVKSNWEWPLLVNLQLKQKGFILHRYSIRKPDDWTFDTTCQKPANYSARPLKRKLVLSSTAATAAAPLYGLHDTTATHSLMVQTLP